MIENKGNPAHDKKPYNQEGIIKHYATDCQLIWRNKPYYDSKGRGYYAHDRGDPDPFMREGDLIDPWHMGFGIS